MQRLASLATRRAERERTGGVDQRRFEGVVNKNVSVRELGIKTGLAILPCRRPELQIDPDLISLIGCLSLQERARTP